MTEQLELIAREVLVQYPVKRAAFFGSAARKNMSETSDSNDMERLIQIKA